MDKLVLGELCGRRETEKESKTKSRGKKGKGNCDQDATYTIDASCIGQNTKEAKAKQKRINKAG